MLYRKVGINVLNTPLDFLEFHQAKARCRGMRSKIFKAETALNIDEFLCTTLKKFIVGGG